MGTALPSPVAIMTDLAPAEGGDPWAAGLLALRKFYRPFVLIQSMALVLVIAYYRSDTVREVCARLAAFKAAGGLLFSAATASFAGGILPEIAKVLGDRRRYTLQSRGGEILFNLAFFAFNGLVIDFLYRTEGHLFGLQASLGTVAQKTAFDQFVFTPLWLPLIITLYLWRKERFSLSAIAKLLRVPGFYRKRVLPLLLPDWFFWIPMVSIIYALPMPLQFLLFVLALGAWSLIMVSIATGSDVGNAQGGGGIGSGKGKGAA